MTDQPGTPTDNPKKKWLLGGIVVAVLLLVAAFVVPRIYAAKESSDVAAPSLTSSSAQPSNENGAETSEQATGQTTDLPEGELTTTNGSYAGYRVEEVLNGADVTVVGRTEQVDGRVTVENATLTAAEIKVDLASVSTDSDRRDNYFRTRAIDTSVHPEATFTLREDVPLDGVSTDPIEVTVVGELSMNGNTQQVSVPLQVARQGEQVVVVGNVPVTWSDYGVDAPRMGFVSVEDDGFLEFELHFN